MERGDDAQQPCGSPGRRSGGGTTSASDRLLDAVVGPAMEGSERAHVGLLRSERPRWHHARSGGGTAGRGPGPDRAGTTALYPSSSTVSPGGRADLDVGDLVAIGGGRGRQVHGLAGQPLPRRDLLRASVAGRHAPSCTSAPRSRGRRCSPRSSCTRRSSRVPQPTWVSESHPSTGPLPTGGHVHRCRSGRPASARPGRVAAIPSWRRHGADRDRRRSGDQAAGDPGAPALGPVDAAYQRGEQGVGTGVGSWSGSTDLDRHPGQQSGQPGQLADRRARSRGSPAGAARRRPAPRGRGRRGRRRRLVLANSRRHAPTPISSRASRRARRA